jgi:hypothetical protein
MIVVTVYELGVTTGATGTSVYKAIRWTVVED